MTDHSRRLNFFWRRRLPVLIQDEVAECGLSCVAMIATYYGFDTDQRALRRRFPISNRGTSLAQLRSICESIGLSSRAVSFGMSELRSVSLPAILHWDKNHFVVLKRTYAKSVVVHDPAVGVRRLSYEEVENGVTGAALELQPSASFEEAQERERVRLSDLWNNAAGIFTSSSYIFLLSAVLQFMAVLSPLYMQLVLDKAVAGADTSLLNILAIAFGLLLVVDVFITALRELVVLTVSSKLMLHLNSAVFQHLLSLPLAYFHSRPAGEVVSRFGSLGAVRDILTVGLVTALLDGIMAIAMLVVMFYYSAPLTVMVLVAVFIHVSFRAVTYQTYRTETQQLVAYSAEQSSFFIESIKGIETLRAFGEGGRRKDQWMSYFVRTMNKSIRIAKWNTVFGIVRGLAFGLLIISIVYFGASSVLAGAFSIGMLVAFIAYVRRFTSATQGLVANLFAIRLVDVHLNRLGDIVLEPSDELERQMRETADTTADDAEEQVGNGMLRVTDLSFRFEGAEDDLFVGVDFVAEPGEVVAVVGPSGTGKTTLVRCLLGLLPASRGEILLGDKTPVGSVRYRKSVASVHQSDTLFTGTIAENISFFRGTYDTDRLKYATEIAEVHSSILAMPMGFNTPVGTEGVSLSGGERQRILCARAMYTHPRLLILDEAMSNVDLKTELQVLRNIKKLGCTIVVVSHRPEIHRFADKRVELAQWTRNYESGRVETTGVGF